MAVSYVNAVVADHGNPSVERVAVTEELNGKRKAEDGFFAGINDVLSGTDKDDTITRIK